MNKLVKGKNSGTKNAIIFSVLIVAYRIVLDYIYSNVISTRFAYEGFENNYTIGVELASFAVLGCLIPIMIRMYKNEDNRLSKEILLMMFLMSFVPFTSMCGFGVFDISFVVSNLLFWVCMIGFTISPIRLKKRVRLKVSGSHLLGETHIKVVTILFALIVLYISARYTHFRFNFNLLNVYDLRAEARSYNLPTLLTYAFSWTRTINSILLAYFLRRKKWMWVIVCIIVQLLNFGVDGSKTTLFLMLFAIVVCLIPKFDLQSLNRWLVIGSLCLCVFCILAYMTFHNIVPISIFVRRLLFVPVDISSKYYDFFTTHVPDYYRQSFLRLFGFESPYDPLAYMIGDYYYNQVSSANNGLIADAISNLGVPGVVIVPIMYAIVFRILDNVTERLDPRLHVTVAMYVAITLINTFLFRVLLTHGLIVAMIILHFIDVDDQEGKDCFREEMKQKRYINGDDNSYNVITCDVR